MKNFKDNRKILELSPKFHDYDHLEEICKNIINSKPPKSLYIEK